MAKNKDPEFKLNLTDPKVSGVPREYKMRVSSLQAQQHMYVFKQVTMQQGELLKQIKDKGDVTAVLNNEFREFNSRRVKTTNAPKRTTQSMEKDAPTALADFRFPVSEPQIAVRAAPHLFSNSPSPHLESILAFFSF